MVVEVVLHVDGEIVLKHVQRVLSLFKRLCTLDPLQSRGQIGE